MGDSRMIILGLAVLAGVAGIGLENLLERLSK